MLPKNRRISRKEFPHILSHGKRYTSPHLLLYLAALPSPAPSRFTFSISKKIYKHAVDRNTYRRRGYNIVSKLLSHITPGYFFFFSFKKGDYPLSFTELEKEIQHLLSDFLI